MALSDSHEVARAVGIAAHPLRLDLLYAFVRGPVQTPAEAALRLGAGLGNVRHHIAVLHREGFLAVGDVTASERGLGMTYEATARARKLVEALAAVDYGVILIREAL